MSWIRKIFRLFNQNRLVRELDEELSSHIDEAIEQGRSPEEARRAFGSPLLQRERSRDFKLLPWLDSLASDIIFGWRQIHKHQIVSAAAILSLALAMGSATAAFQFVDALLLRKLPVADPDHLFYVATTHFDRDARQTEMDSFDYPSYRRYAEAVSDRADLMVVGHISNRNLDFATPEEIDRPYWQYVSGNVFDVFGLQPALGHLLTRTDDLVPGGHPLAVISYEYWTRRFANDPNVLGKSIRVGKDQLQIIGVAPKGFIGTEPGGVTDVFVPASMRIEALNQPDWAWFRIWLRPKPGFSTEQIRQPLQAVFHRQHEADLKRFQPNLPAEYVRKYMSEEVLLLPAAQGVSDVQKQYAKPLWILVSLVVLVLLIACTNVANLLSAQAATRAREIAVRVSIGAGQARLIQLMLVESAMLALFASALGVLFARSTAPIVVAMLHMPEDPVRLVLDAGWIGVAFNFALAFAVTLVFGIAPALRASSVKPISALKGGEQPRSRGRILKVLLAAQMAFCVFVQFVAGLFVSTFDRLNTRSMGFSADHVLVMDASISKKQSPATWMQIGDRIHETPGVESVSLAGWPMLSKNRWTISLRPPGQTGDVSPTYALDVSPGFFETMRIAILGGRDFRLGDVPPREDDKQHALTGVGIVNETFARNFFGGQNPVGRSMEWHPYNNFSTMVEIVGLVRDTAYYDVREKPHAIIYIPMSDRTDDTFFVRTSGNAPAFIETLRHATSNLRADLHVRNIQPQTNFFRWQVLRERLLSILSLFFAAVALILAAIGLFGTLNYSVTRQRREIGIRMTLGAREAQVVARILTGQLAMIGIGLLLGLGGGMISGRFLESLLFEIKPGDPRALVIPMLTLFGAALVAILPPAIRAVRIDPAETLRLE